MKKELARHQEDRRFDGTPQEAARKVSLERFKVRCKRQDLVHTFYFIVLIAPRWLPERH